MPPTGVGRSKQLFEVWIRTIATENAAFAIRAALREVEALAKNGLTQEQFDATLNFLREYTTQFGESTYDRLGYAIDDRYYGIDGHLARFRAATTSPCPRSTRRSRSTCGRTTWSSPR